MLKEKYENVVLIGSSSEIGMAIIKKLPFGESANIVFVGRDNPKDFAIPNLKVKTDFFKCDLEHLAEIKNVAKNMATVGIIDLAIVAAGHLPSENSDLDLDSVFKSMNVNTVGISCILSALASHMIRQTQGKIILISSVAEFRPRSQNFTYGASKSGADFFARGLAKKYKNSGLNVIVVRPGYIFTKMSKGFTPAPFAISPERLATIAVQSLQKNRYIVYTPRKLRFIVSILKITPYGIFAKLTNK